MYQQAIEARPYYWANYFARANFLMRRAEYGQAATVLQQAVAKFPANSFLMRRLGVAEFLEGRFDEAAATFQSAIQASPHAEAYMDLGQVYLHQKKFGPAVAALESAAGLKAHSFAIEADLADAYAWDGQAFKFVTDILGAAPLGLPQNEQQYVPSDPEELLEHIVAMNRKETESALERAELQL